MIFKGLKPYMFRVDLPNNEESTAEILKFFEKYNIDKYYGNPELGEETEKPHYQMIIWMEETTADQRTKMRNWWRGKVKKKKGGGVAISIARKEERLFGYCRKEEKNDILTNVSKEIYLKIPKVNTLKALKEANREKLEKIIGGISRDLSNLGYCEALEKAYFDVYGRPTFRRNYYLENLRKAGYMTSVHVIQTVFPHGIESKSYITDEWKNEEHCNEIDYSVFGSQYAGETYYPKGHPIENNIKVFRKKKLKK